MSDNLPAGAASTLAYLEALADEAEAAEEVAWHRLEDAAPEGVGWEVAHVERGPHGAYVFAFRDGGGYEYTTSVDLTPDEEPPDWWD